MAKDAGTKAAQDEVAEALRRSQPNEAGPHLAPGSMGVSSERVGHAGPGQEGAEGLRQTSSDPRGTESEGDAGDEGAGVEENPTGLMPKAGYPRLDPRHADHPFQVGRAER